MVTALLAFACAPGSGGILDFTLRLRPVTPLNQSDLFDDVDRFTITVERGGGSVEVCELGGPGGDGTVTTPEIAALEERR